MWMDERTLFAEATALGTGGTGLQLVGDVIDLEDVRDIGASENAWLVILIETAVTSAGAATVTFHLASDSAAAIATDGSASVHWSSTAIGKATLVAGYEVTKVMIPLEGSTPYERYLGILADVGTAAVTAGKITAFITNRPPNRKIYPNAVQ